MRGPGQHRRRRLLPYLRRVLATPAVYLRSVAGRGATLGAATPGRGISCGLGRDAPCRWRCLGPRLRAGARRSVPLPAIAAWVAVWGATLGAATRGRGISWRLGRDARCRWRCLGPRLRAGARRSVPLPAIAASDAGRDSLDADAPMYVSL
jgi:hypothetical protein